MKKQVKIGSRNVFEDMGYPDAGKHLLKAQIVAEILSITQGRKLTQKKAGEIMGITQPEVSRMMNWHFREYSMERLMGFLTLFNRDVEIVVRRREANKIGRGHVSFVPVEAVS